MRRYHLGILGVIFAGMALMAVVSPADAVTATGNVNVQWHALPVINFSLTPNYHMGYGSVIATFGTQPTPTTGPGATGVGTGTVDFGTTIAGDTYLYKYAAHLHVTTNDASGFYVYGEAAAYITNNTTSTQSPQAGIFYLPSGASSDSNTGYTPGFQFAVTSGLVSGGTDNVGNPASITYSSYPSPIAMSGLPNNDYYYDYQFRVPGNSVGGNYYVWIVYTVVGL